MKALLIEFAKAFPCMVALSAAADFTTGFTRSACFGITLGVFTVLVRRP